MKTIIEIQAMSAAEKDAAIAIITGWRHNARCPCGCGEQGWWAKEGEQTTKTVPRYSSSLDAMAPEIAKLDYESGELEQFAVNLDYVILLERKAIGRQLPQFLARMLFTADQAATAFIFTMQTNQPHQNT